VYFIEHTRNNILYLPVLFMSKNYIPAKILKKLAKESDEVSLF
jgi:hypothetical protein